jgi:hypothetical protein
MNEMARGRPVADGGTRRAIRFEGDVPRELGPDRMPVRHAVTHETAQHFDPFLYFAHFGPEELHRTGWGFPPHPHRGFETITYMLEGRLEHRDSVGAHAILEPGDVQWMTAGGGIVHAEEPPADFRRTGGTVHGFQIWLDLPRPLKMTAPGFQMLRAADMPVIEPAAGVTVRIIGGSLGDVASPVTTHSPVQLFHVSLAAGAAWDVPVADGHALFAYGFGGPADGRLRLFETGGTVATVEGDEAAATEWLVLGGARLEQPIAAYGPFVMSTREELVQAFEDYKSGRMGTVAEV